MFVGRLRTPVISEIFSSLALLRSQLSANGPENLFVTFYNEFRILLSFAIAYCI